ncbi:MAG: PIG-L deacetylase family protein [Blastococcus sp.]
MNVLAIGAHPDDIELGCGGALLRHAAAGHRVTMLVMTTGERGPQDAVSRVIEQEEAARIMGADLIWGGLADGAIPHDRETVALIDDAIRRCAADVLYTHSSQDSHQDHVSTAACSLSAARRLSRVLCYQAPSTNAFEPTVFVDVEGQMSGKIAALEAHRSQVLRCQLVDLEAVEATGRYWGHRSRMRFAEAFETPRFVWDIEQRPASRTMLVGDTRRPTALPRAVRPVAPAVIPAAGVGAAVARLA